MDDSGSQATDSQMICEADFYYFDALFPFEEHIDSGQRPKCLPFLNPDLTLSYLQYFELIMHFELQMWTAVQQLQEEGQRQVMENAGRATREQQPIATAVVSLYRGERPGFIASTERTPLLIRTFIQLIHWHTRDPSDADINEYLDAIRNYLGPQGGYSDTFEEELSRQYNDNFAAVFQFAAALALSRSDIPSAEAWLKLLFPYSSIGSVEMDVLRVVLAQCYWKQGKLDECGNSLNQVIGKELPAVYQLTKEDLGRRLLEANNML